MFYYEGTLTRVRLINNFPQAALSNLHPDAEWAAQLLIISRWFSTPDGDWMPCCDADSSKEDPNIYIEKVVGGSGPITLKGPHSKDIVAGKLLLAKDVEYLYNVEQHIKLVYHCADIYTKQVKNKKYLRRHQHIEKGGRLLWNMSSARFVEIIPDSHNFTVGEAVDLPSKDEQFVSAVVAEKV